MGNCFSENKQSEQRYLQKNIRKNEESQIFDVRNLQRNPYNYIAVITSSMKSLNPFNVTGVFLSNNLILTVSHVLYNKQQKQLNTDLMIYYEVINGKKCQYHIEKWRYLPEYQVCSSKKNVKFDYALISLKPFKGQPICFNSFPSLVVTCKLCLKKSAQQKMAILGYSLNKTNRPKFYEEIGTMLYQYGFYLKGKIEEIHHKKSFIYYKAIHDGLSGSPIMMDGNIIGIHNVKNSLIDKNFYEGRLVTYQMTQNILKWSKQLKGDPITIIYNGQCCKKQEKNDEFVNDQYTSDAKRQEKKALGQRQKKENHTIRPMPRRNLEKQEQQQQQIFKRQQFYQPFRNQTKKIPAYKLSETTSKQKQY